MRARNASRVPGGRAGKRTACFAQTKTPEANLTNYGEGVID